MIKYCLFCGKPLNGKRGGAKFCSLECKNAYNYRHRSGLQGIPDKKINPLELTMKGIIEPEQEHEKNPETEIHNKDIRPYKDPQVNIDAEFFSAMMNENIINVGSENQPDDEPENENDSSFNDDDYLDEKDTRRKESETAPLNSLLPEKYITKSVQKSNPLYGIYQANLNELIKEKAMLEQEFKKLLTELNYQESRNGNGFVWGGGLGAGALALLNSSPAKHDEETEVILRDKNGKIIPFKSKKKQKKATAPKNSGPGFWERVLTVALFGAIGTGAGYIAKNATEEWRKKDKREKIAAINKRMAEVHQKYLQLQAAIQNTNGLMGTTPKTVVRRVQLINPEYEKVKNKQSVLNLSVKQEQPNNKMAVSGLKTPKVKFKSDKIMKATDLAKMEYKALNFQGLWREFFGLPSINFHLLIHGNSGEGKSTFAMWLAKYLAQNFGRVLYVSGEEGVNMTFHDKLKFCKAEVENFYVLDVRTGDQFMNEVGVNEFHFIILDSLHDMDIDAKKLKEIFEQYPNSAFICIDQNNKKGELLGANEKKHLCDTVVNVKDFIAETTKNRFKLKGEVFKTEDFTKPDSTKIIALNQKNKKRDGYDLDSDRRNLV